MRLVDWESGDWAELQEFISGLLVAGLRTYPDIAEWVEAWVDDSGVVAPDEAAALLASLWTQRLAETAGWADTGDFGRLDAALAALAGDGVLARMCFSCYTACATHDIDAQRTRHPDPPDWYAYQQWADTSFHEQEEQGTEPTGGHTVVGLQRISPASEPAARTGRRRVSRCARGRDRGPGTHRPAGRCAGPRAAHRGRARGALVGGRAGPHRRGHHPVAQAATRLSMSSLPSLPDWRLSMTPPFPRALAGTALLVLTGSLYLTGCTSTVAGTALRAPEPATAGFPASAPGDTSAPEPAAESTVAADKLPGLLLTPGRREPAGRGGRTDGDRQLWRGLSAAAGGDSV
jgi:hypothetical protein